MTIVETSIYYINSSQTHIISKNEKKTFTHFINKKKKGPRLVVSPSLDQSRRSSLSESSAISGFSSASARTFVHEASTLVLETVENGVKR